MQLVQTASDAMLPAKLQAIFVTACITPCMQLWLGSHCVERSAGYHNAACYVYGNGKQLDVAYCPVVHNMLQTSSDVAIWLLQMHISCTVTGLITSLDN